VLHVRIRQVYFGAILRWENDYWESCSASKLLGEIVTRQIVAARVAPCVEPPSDKALVESLLIELLGKLVVP
jgi:hypothetical protein